jgi:hypothetical protein
VSVKDDKGSRRTSTSKMTENYEKIWEFIHEDCHWTNHELADTTGISYGVRQETSTENMNMRRTAMKFVLQLLTNDQKQRWINVSLAMREG